MSNDLIVHGQQAKTAPEVKAEVNRIQEIMESVMKKGEHYDVIPGCGNKMTLLKPGAEKILSTFGIAVDPEIEDLSTKDEIRYRVKCYLYSAGTMIGAGVGECSSNEEKYKWKKPTCKEEWEATPEDRRRMKWFKGYQGKKAYEAMQIRTEPADVANTVLKMSKKRSMIDGTLTSTGASDIFAQDLEDTPPPDTGEQAPPDPIQSPQPKGDKVPPVMEGTLETPFEAGDISEPQIKKLQAMLGGIGIKDEYEKHIKVSKLLGFKDVVESFTYLTKAHASTLFKAIEAEQKAAK
jgi:hypothetical protein